VKRDGKKELSAVCRACGATCPVESIRLSELPQKPRVVLVEEPDVGHAIANYRDAFDAEAAQA
jgi:coenzyme F420-reducing hydrogenase beta subunit